MMMTRRRRRRRFDDEDDESYLLLHRLRFAAHPAAGREVDRKRRREEKREREGERERRACASKQSHRKNYQCCSRSDSAGSNVWQREWGKAGVETTKWVRWDWMGGEERGGPLRSEPC